jgi:hypothetical protein
LNIHKHAIFHETCLSLLVAAGKNYNKAAIDCGLAGSDQHAGSHRYHELVGGFALRLEFELKTALLLDVVLLRRSRIDTNALASDADEGEEEDDNDETKPRAVCGALAECNTASALSARRCSACCITTGWNGRVGLVQNQSGEVGQGFDGSLSLLATLMTWDVQ